MPTIVTSSGHRADCSRTVDGDQFVVEGVGGGGGRHISGWYTGCLDTLAVASPGRRVPQMYT